MNDSRQQAPTRLQSVRTYLLAALLFPPRGVQLGWRMKNQPLAVRVLLGAFPLVGPVLGAVTLFRALY